jgi:hypothetical protein
MRGMTCTEVSSEFDELVKEQRRTALKAIAFHARMLTAAFVTVGDPQSAETMQTVVDKTMEALDGSK